MTLATDLLPLAKQQMNITFSDDDTLITAHLNWAISFCQNESGWLINSASYVWLPVVASSPQSKYAVPYRPVSSFTLTSGGVDISDQFELQPDGRTGPIWLVRLDGSPFPADAEVNLVVGYATSAEMPPEFEAAILRMTSALYENRGSITAITLDTVPHWFRDLLQGVWVPRA